MGWGEYANREIARRLKRKIPVSEMTDIRGTAFIANHTDACAFPAVEVASFETVSTDKRQHARAVAIEYEEHDPVRGKAILQRHGDQILIVNPPAMPLNTQELDAVAALPFTREPHPIYRCTGWRPRHRRSFVFP